MDSRVIRYIFIVVVMAQPYFQAILFGLLAVSRSEYVVSFEVILGSNSAYPAKLTTLHNYLLHLFRLGLFVGGLGAGYPAHYTSTSNVGGLSTRVMPSTISPSMQTKLSCCLIIFLNSLHCADSVTLIYSPIPLPLSHSINLASSRTNSGAGVFNFNLPLGKA